MRTTHIGVAAALAIAGVASGGIVEYFDRASWEAAVGGIFTLETLEDDPIHELFEPEALLGSGLIIDANPPGVTTEVTNEETFTFNTTPGGTKHLRFISFGDYEALMTTPSAVIAFAFDISGFQDFLGQGGFAVELLLGGFAVDSFFINDPGNFGPNFHGWVSDSFFDTVSFTFLGADFVGFDQIAFVPGPPVLALLAVSLVTTVRRKRKQTGPMHPSSVR